MNKSFEARNYKPFKIDILSSAIAVFEGSYKLNNVSEDYKEGVRSGVRQVMMRVGLYDQFCEAIE